MQMLSPGDITTKDRRIQIVSFQQLAFVEMREETRFARQKADFYGQAESKDMRFYVNTQARNRRFLCARFPLFCECNFHLASLRSAASARHRHYY
jgi:hypothetical protein